MEEIEKIEQRYEERKSNAKPVSDSNFYFSWYMQTERELLYAEILRKYFGNNQSDLKLLEIGAGSGDNLYFFERYGLKNKNIWANELLPDRFSSLKTNFPDINLDMGDASKLPYKEEFDIVFQSTVFTSILDHDFKKKLAEKMLEMTKANGLILWYDFKYNNPSNKNVKGVGKNEIRELFSSAQNIIFFNTTLAPPIGRRVKKFYRLVNFLFPFFRTHLVAVIRK